MVLAPNELRNSVIRTAREMMRAGLCVNTSGNVSAAIPGTDAFLITPSGVPYEELEPASIVLMRRTGLGAWEPEGSFAPSSEWQLHAEAYSEKREIRAIVHTHSPKATAVSCLEEDIPPFHYMVAAAGGIDIPYAPYATFGTRELALSAAKALEHRRGCLLAHHGVVATGDSLRSALALALEIENLARMYLDLRASGGMKLLPEEEMRRVAERFLSYGQPKRRNP